MHSALSRATTLRNAIAGMVRRSTAVVLVGSTLFFAMPFRLLQAEHLCHRPGYTTLLTAGMLHVGTTEMDGVPGVTQCFIPPGATYEYGFRASLAGTYCE